jgi:uncharacterized protein YjbI with pentapeptide repeats
VAVTPSTGATRWAGRRRRHPALWGGLVAAAIAVIVPLVVWVLPSVLTRSPDVTGAERHKAMADVRTGLIAMLGAIGAAGGLAYTAKTFRLSQIAHLTGRFQEASKQMGADHPTVRLGGIQAMAQLADEWFDQRQRCVDVLCAYVRAPVETEEAQADRDRDSRRRTLELITERLRARAATTWIGCDFDFEDAVLEDGDFTGVSFSEGRFSFDRARFIGRVTFDEATFTGAAVTFADARFERGCEVSFDDAKFLRGAVGFDDVNFAGGTVWFRSALFDSGCKVTFAEARLGNGGNVSFEDARFAGGITFAKARFVTGQDGGGDVSFRRAKFKGAHTSFEGATFAREIRFDDAHLEGGELSFRSATFKQERLRFDKAHCSGARFLVGEAKCELGGIAVHGSDGTPTVVGGALEPPLFPRD